MPALNVYPNRDEVVASDFLRRRVEFFPFTIEKILTEDGRAFTLKNFRNCYGAAKKLSLFTQVCRNNAIGHRQTQPYTPKTNGMVERATV